MLSIQPGSLRSDRLLPMSLSTRVDLSDIPSDESELPFRWLTTTKLSLRPLKRWNLSYEQSYGENTLSGDAN